MKKFKKNKLSKIIFFTTFIACSGLTGVSLAAEPVSGFNCTEDEIAAYIDKSTYQRGVGAGFNTSPNIVEYIPVFTNKELLEKGENGTDCNTIFGASMEDFGELTSVFDKIQGIFTDPVGTGTQIANEASKRVNEIYASMNKTQSKSMCDRLSKKAATNAIGDQINQVWRENTRGTVLSGVGMNGRMIGEDVLNGGGVSVTDPIGKNFSYQIIKNMLGQNGKYVGRVLKSDGSINDRGLSNGGSGVVDDVLDTIEGKIF